MTEQLEQPPLADNQQAEARQALDEAAASASGRTLFAVVDGDGTLARGVGAVSATKFTAFPGAYAVIFDRDVDQGAFVATIGLSQDAGQSLPGEIVVNLREGTTNGVFVETSDDAGANADRSFHLVVVLP
jgi:hypothetical protein